MDKTVRTNLSCVGRQGFQSSLLVFLLLLWLCGLAQSQTLTPVPDPEATATTRIEPGCTLTILVTDEPKLSGQFLVDNDGKIHFALTDEDGNNKQEWSIEVKGQLADEARRAITDSLRNYLRDPEVRVAIAKLPRLRVEVRGAARKTGVIELSRKAHLSDVMLACLYKPNADLANILITRKKKPEPGASNNAKTTEIVHIDFLSYQTGESAEDPKVEEGDVILLQSLPEATKAAEPQTVNVIGEVKNESRVVCGPGMTVNDALNRAGGLTERADPEAIRLVRHANGNVYVLNLAKIETNDPLYNMKIEAGDLLIVGKRDRSLQFAVLGEVAQPSTFEWRKDQPMTILKAIEQAGGVTKNAERRKGVLRKGFLLHPEQPRDIPFDLDEIVKGKQPDYEVEAGDAVYFVPRQKKPSFFQQLMPLLFRFIPLGI